jgi:hypothetical protein
MLSWFTYNCIDGHQHGADCQENDLQGQRFLVSILERYARAGLGSSLPLMRMQRPTQTSSGNSGNSAASCLSLVSRSQHYWTMGTGH